MRIATLDIESNNLLDKMIDFSSMPYKLNDTAKIRVVSVCDVDTKKATSLVKEEITKEALEKLLKPYDVIIAHNGHKFDLPALQLFGLIDYKVGYLDEPDMLNGKEVRLLDTLILSRLSDPDRFQGHSLDSWGKRIGVHKTDYRSRLIQMGAMERSQPKGFEFSFFHPLMVEYCEQDTITTAYAYEAIMKEYEGYTTARSAVKQEHKTADLGIRRELLGFHFDKELALENVEFLTNIMSELADKVNPILPKKPLTQTNLNDYTPPAKQTKADGSWSANMVKFLEKMEITDHSSDLAYFTYKGQSYNTPYYEPLETEVDATIDDLDVVKQKLIDLGWEPSEWKERDLTKNAKKENLPFDKRLKALEKYVKETLSGKYKESRLKILGIPEEILLTKLTSDLRGVRAVKVPTSPAIKVGVTKDLCPNLVELGDKVEFAKDVADYYTYRHRKSAIAGGDISDMDLEDDAPDKGYLANYREADGRIPTPAIEIGTSTNRYKHQVVANVPRASSLFGKEMRAMFCSGPDFVYFGFDYASLEARIEGNYVYGYEGGPELAVSLLAEKPNDIHSQMALKLNIPRDQAKSVNYAILYGASVNKFIKMLGLSKAAADKFYKDYWDGVPALKQLKEDKEREWIASGKKYIQSIDGRRIKIRSQHSILNALFQSAGVICAKYVSLKMFQKFEALGYSVDVLKDKINIGLMISYHDEEALAINKDILTFKTFKTEEEAKEFKSSWTGEQLGGLQEGKKGFYITMPNTISKIITESIKEVQELFDMKVDLGYEYVTGRNWKDCH